MKSYSSTDLAAILGHKQEDNPFAAFAAAATSSRNNSAVASAGRGIDEDSEVSDEAEPSGPGKQKSLSAEAREEKEAAEEREPAVMFAAPDDASKW